MRIQDSILVWCLCATPAFADSPVQINQVTAILNLGTGNASTITQVGSNNIAETDQSGSLGIATISQIGNNNLSQIVQTNAGDVAINNQIGDGLKMRIVQTGPAQHISITQRR
jgi:minor curlin subunit